MIKLTLNPIVLKSAIADSGATRTPTGGERQQITRIMRAMERATTDQNIQDYFVNPEMSSSDFLMLISSGCPEVIELALLLNALQGDWRIYPDQKTSIAIGILAIEPRIFPQLLQSFGWRFQDNTENILKTITIRYRWKRRPRRSTRKRGYQDHGSLSNEQHKLREMCLSTYYIEQFEQLRRTDKETQDLLEFLVGFLM